MAERDLKLICDAIPASYDASISTQAHEILKALSGEEIEFDIQTGGDQPTLYSAPLSQSYNSITVDVATANSKNGQFSDDAVLKCYVGGVEVILSASNTYTVTADDDGKVFSCVISREKFSNGTSTVTCNYVDYSGNTITIQVDLTNFIHDPNVVYMAVCSAYAEGYNMKRNGEFPSNTSETKTVFFYIDSSGNLHFPAPNKMVYQYKHAVNGNIGSSDNSYFPFYYWSATPIQLTSTSIADADDFISGSRSFCPRYAWPRNQTTSTGTSVLGNVIANFVIKNENNITLGTWSVNFTGNYGNPGTWSPVAVSASSGDFLQISGTIQFSF